MRAEKNEGFIKEATGMFPVVIERPVEVLVEKVNKNNELTTDQINYLKRRIIIGINTYGIHNLSAVASFVGSLSMKEIKDLIEKDNELRDSIEQGKIVCWTKAELIARLCIEAETASRSQDRINAITKIMEFRGLTKPEGGERSFSRVVTQFIRQPNQIESTLEKK